MEWKLEVPTCWRLPHESACALVADEFAKKEPGSQSPGIHKDRDSRMICMETLYSVCSHVAARNACYQHGHSRRVDQCSSPGEDHDRKGVDHARADHS